MPIRTLDLDEAVFWTEQAYLSLGETMTRIELVDGSLWVSAPSNNAHSQIVSNLCGRLIHATHDRSLRATSWPNLRLGPDRILIPDIAVGHFGRTATVSAADDATLVVEVTAPGSATADRTLKRRLYAEAKIGWYLLVEPNFADYESVSLYLLRRHADEYAVHAVAERGETLVSELPFPLRIDPAQLLDF